MRLVLFDIDGTLISDNGAARQAYGQALAQVYRFTGSLDSYDFSGRTDRQITDMVLGDAGYSQPEIEQRIELLWDHYLEGLRVTTQSKGIRVLPGVASLLGQLAAHPGVTLGLLTGNIERGARIKLDPPGLNRYFPFGAFGSDSKDRAELPPIAVKRASSFCAHQFERREVVIIGDSIFDIRCGVPHEATTIAVASSRTAAETLRAEKPTFLFSSLEPTDDVLEAILGS